MTLLHANTRSLALVFLLALIGLSSSKAEFFINEFLADNSGTIQTDEDGFPADWIEIHNPGPAASLNGYTLSDDPTHLTKWTFPEVTIPSNGYLLVFATGKDRTLAGSELHTNFRLDASGDYLALVKPDGITTLSLFSPEYPQQYPDISYGLGTGGPVLQQKLHAVGEALSYHVPSEEIGSTWQNLGYDDSLWTPGHTAVGWGYNTSVGDEIAEDGDLTAPMRGTNASIYMRLPFQVDDPSEVTKLVLKMKVADGFVAYLNGFEVASKNKPSPLTFDAVASGEEEIRVGDQFEVSSLNFAGRLQNGENILALHGLNDSKGSSDFIVIPELVAEVQDSTSLSGPSYLAEPTPNDLNGAPSLAPPGKVEFDTTSRAFTEDFEVSLSVANPNAVIYYTTDGSLPTNNISAPSLEYSGPILIVESTLIRARAFFPGSLPGEGRTEGYFKLADDVADNTSDLPVVLLSTFGGGEPPASGLTNRKAGFMLIYEPDPVTGRTTFNSTPSIATRGGIRKRGSSSAGFPKFGMSLETWDEFDEDKDIEPLGLAPEADWILNTRYRYDFSLMRNPFLYELSNQIGQWAVKTRFIEIYNDFTGGEVVANDYYGVYCLMEKIEPDKNRLDISKLDPWENTPEEITGGYVFKSDRHDPDDTDETTFEVDGFRRMNFVDPDGDEVSPEQYQYLEAQTNELTAALRQPDGINTVTGKHFTEYLEVDDFVDNFWLNILAMDPDWGQLSQFFYKDRNGKIKAGPLWDYDRAMGSRDERDNDPLRWEAPKPSISFTWFDDEYEWFGLLFGFNVSHQTFNLADPQLKTSRKEVFQKIIDRWYELRSDQFAQSNFEAIVDSMAVELNEAQVRNFERWQVYQPGEDDDRYYSDPGTAGWEKEVSHLKGWLEARSEWIDEQFFSPPVFSQEGGSVDENYLLTMSVAQGDVYYTTDSTDPRAPGGAPTTEAILGTMATLTETTTVFARAYDGAQWGAPTIATFVIGADHAGPNNLVISEIMYQPAEPSEDEITAGFIDNKQFEYLEMMNISGNTIDLTNVSFSEGIDFDFAGSAITTLGPDERVLIVRDPAAFEYRFGAALNALVAGEFSNDTGLAGKGEQIILLGFDGSIRDFTYNDKYPWPESADGDGPSLVLIAPESDPDHDLAANWRPSIMSGGAPGASDASAGFTGDPHADLDGNGQGDFLDYGLAGSSPPMTVVFDPVAGTGTMTFLRNLAADDVIFEFVTSTDLSLWTPGGAIRIASFDHGDGTATETWQAVLPMEVEDTWFIRLKLTGR